MNRTTGRNKEQDKAEVVGHEPTSLISSTSPPTGAYTSLAAFTDSTDPKDSLQVHAERHEHTVGRQRFREGK